MKPKRKQEIASVHFVAGCVIEHDYVYVAAKADGLDPLTTDFTRMFFLDRGEWVHHDLPWDVKSVCVRRAHEPRQYVALSLQGDVELQFVGGQELERIPGAGTREGAGALSQVREVGGHLVACGFSGQVYLRGSEGWEPLGGGLAALGADKGEIHLTGIDGTGLDDLYAVGFHGRIFHFDGRAWSELESPTRAHLECVRVDGDRVFIAGNDGTVLEGNRRGLRALATDGFTEHLWGLARFQGRTYVAHLGGLRVHDGLVARGPGPRRLGPPRGRLPPGRGGRGAVVLRAQTGSLLRRAHLGGVSPPRQRLRWRAPSGASSEALRPGWGRASAPRTTPRCAPRPPRSGRWWRHRAPPGGWCRRDPGRAARSPRSS